MAKTNQATLIDRVLRDKARLMSCRKMVDQANNNVNISIYKANAGGVSRNELARTWGTSPARIRERITAGKFLAENQS